MQIRSSNDKCILSCSVYNAWYIKNESRYWFLQFVFMFCPLLLVNDIWYSFFYIIGTMHLFNAILKEIIKHCPLSKV